MIALSTRSRNSRTPQSAKPSMRWSARGFDSKLSPASCATGSAPERALISGESLGKPSGFELS